MIFFEFKSRKISISQIKHSKLDKMVGILNSGTLTLNQQEG